jgi:hypothetical protein
MLHRVKDKRNILCTVTRRKSQWIGLMLHRNCFLKHVIEGTIDGRIEVEGRRGRRRKQILNDRKETSGYWNWKKKHWFALCGELALEDAMDLLVRQTTEWMNERINEWLNDMEFLLRGVNTLSVLYQRLRSVFFFYTAETVREWNRWWTSIWICEYYCVVECDIT